MKEATMREATMREATMREATMREATMREAQYGITPDCAGVHTTHVPHNLSGLAQLFTHRK